MSRGRQAGVRRAAPATSANARPPRSRLDAAAEAFLEDVTVEHVAEADKAALQIDA
jgi:hypothetical protein